jgi:hypothetical protein
MTTTNEVSDANLLRESAVVFTGKYDSKRQST